MFTTMSKFTPILIIKASFIVTPSVNILYSERNVFRFCFKAKLETVKLLLAFLDKMYNEIAFGFCVANKSVG